MLPPGRATSASLLSEYCTLAIVPARSPRSLVRSTRKGSAPSSRKQLWQYLRGMWQTDRRAELVLEQAAVIAVLSDTRSSTGLGDVAMRTTRQVPAAGRTLPAWALLVGVGHNPESRWRPSKH